MEIKLPVRSLLLASAFVWQGFSSALAQQAPWCGTRPISTDPAEVSVAQQIEAHAQAYMQQLAAKKRASQGKGNTPQSTGTPLVVPVVVHVVYSDIAQAPTVQEVISQINLLNEDFARTNADQVNTPQPHLSVAAGSSIEFRLATADPTGACTTGIEYTETSTLLFDTNGESIKHYAIINGSNQGGANAWDSKHYLNIWVGELDRSTGVSGYSTYASQRFAPSEDGVVVDYNFFNTRNPAYLGRVLTHEVGHYFDLRHIFGGFSQIVAPASDVCADDLISDTYPVQGTPISPGVNQVAYFDCTPHFSDCNGTGNAIRDMDTNYMAYTPGACMNMFTAGQVARMESVLSPGGFRASLLDNASAFTPQARFASTLPASFCGDGEFALLVHTPVPCNPRDYATSFTFTIDPVDIRTSFGNIGNQISQITVPASSGLRSQMLSFANGDYVRNISVVANFASGTQSLPDVQRLQVRSQAPRQLSDPSALAFFQEKYNSCYFGVSVPAIEGADVYLVSVTAPDGTQTSGNTTVAPPDPSLAGQPLPDVQVLTSTPAPTTPGDYQILITARNRCGTSVSGYYPLHLDAAPSKCYPRVTNRASASTPEKQTEISLFPNPAMQEVTIKSAFDAGYTRGCIRSMMGIVVKSFEVTAKDQTLRLDDIKPGLYLVELQGKAGLTRQQLSIGTL